MWLGVHMECAWSVPALLRPTHHPEGLEIRMPTTLKDVPGSAPHGGALELRLATDEEKSELASAAASLPTIEAGSRRILSDLELLATGAVSPNRGFMTSVHDQDGPRLGRR